MMHCSRILLLVLLLPSVLLTACGDKREGAETRVIAKVNGDEISANQMNFAMARLGNIPKGKEDEANKQVLKGLVDQQILVRQALDKKLDRNPNVLQAIEASKRQILAQSFVEQIVQQIVKPTDDEIHDYYVKAPELFSNRRIYKFGEISLSSAIQIDEVKRLLAGVKSLEEFAGKLHKENIEFKAVSAAKAAEELPLDILPRFSKLAKGEVAIIPIGDSLSVLQLQDSREQPLTEQQAKPIIGKFLLEQKRKTLFEAEMKKLRDASKVEYFGAYVDAGKTQQYPAAAQPTPAQPAPVASAAPQAEPAATKDSHVVKGLSGLK